MLKHLHKGWGHSARLWGEVGTSPCCCRLAEWGVDEIKEPGGERGKISIVHLLCETRLWLHSPGHEGRAYLCSLSAPFCSTLSCLRLAVHSPHSGVVQSFCYCYRDGAVQVCAEHKRSWPKNMSHSLSPQNSPVRDGRSNMCEALLKHHNVNTVQCTQHVLNYRMPSRNCALLLDSGHMFKCILLIL